MLCIDAYLFSHELRNSPAVWTVRQHPEEPSARFTLRFVPSSGWVQLSSRLLRCCALPATTQRLSWQVMFHDRRAPEVGQVIVACWRRWRCTTTPFGGTISTQPTTATHQHLPLYTQRTLVKNSCLFLPARRYASAGNSDHNVSVRLSVRHAPVFCQNEES